jgi:CTP:phosphocholine cytidylyltransferase-like protein
MHTVKRAVILAAGQGQRLRPATHHTPKPLVTVQGKAMIETILEALHQNGIFEIYIVVGYHKDQFQPLAAAHPGVQLIENPYYLTCNNISSLYVARDHLEEAIILDGDQVIYDPSILAPAFAHSGYQAVWTEATTQEWLLTVEQGRITACCPQGGSHGWQLYSISRWTKEDGQRLKALVEQEFDLHHRRDIYWDELALLIRPQDFYLEVRPMAQGAVLEIDSFQELLALDPSYGERFGGSHEN